MKDGQKDWHFVIWFMAATGARVSELLQIKAEHVLAGHIDLYTKGGKVRRIYIPRTLQNKALLWLSEWQISSGYIFLNRFGKRITTRGIAMQLKHFADKYGLRREVVYPHSFRHRFAKNFLDKYNDIALLADLMGHESIDCSCMSPISQSTPKKSRTLEDGNAILIVLALNGNTMIYTILFILPIDINLMFAARATFQLYVMLNVFFMLKW